MTSASEESTRALLRWMREEHLRGLDVGPMLRDNTLEELRESLREHPQWRTVGVFRYLLNAAHEELDRNPAQALTITTVLIEYLDETEAPEHARVPLLLLRATAWKEYANALRVTGDINGARDALHKAMDLLPDGPSYEYQHATLKMLAAHLQQEQGHVVSALSLLEQCREVFDRLHERGQAARARMFEAAFRFEADPDSAERLWRAAIDDVESIGDYESVARITQNLGAVAAMRGDEKTANEYFDRALSLFEQSGMKAEKTRVRWGRAALYRKLGRLDAALKELQQTRAELAADGRTLQAAQASLEVIELLLAIERRENVQNELAELANLFAQAGMTTQTRRALAYLAEVGTIDVSRVAAVRDFFGSLESNPHAAFAAPTGM